LVSNTYTVTSDVTFYPIFKKDSVNKELTFHKNGNNGYTYSWVAYTEDITFNLCTIAERYNNEEDVTSCTWRITLPSISASTNTPNVSWWTVWTQTQLYAAGKQIDVTAEVNDVIEFYAQTYSEPKTYRVHYEYGTGVEVWAVTSWSCVIAWTSNGVAQSWSCTVTLPTLVVTTWFKWPLWYKWETTYTGAIDVYGAWTEGVIDGNTLVWKAHPRIDVEYHVKHYFQMLNEDLTWSTNKYKLDTTKTETW
jgi:hypothetical protein